MSKSNEDAPRVAAHAGPRRGSYRPAVTPGLRRVLITVFLLVALLGANSLYLVTVTVLEYARETTYRTISINTCSWVT